MKQLSFIVSILFAACLGFSAAGCGSTSTLPERVRAGDAAPTLTLYIPEEFEVRSADFTATMYGGNTSGSTQYESGRAFIQVFAIHKRTGEQYLLIYENLGDRRKPIQIIRFEARPADEVMR